MAIADEALREEEANALFSGLEGFRGLILAVSGGPDSTALSLRPLRTLAPSAVKVFLSSN